MIHQGHCVPALSDGAYCVLCSDHPAGMEIAHLRRRVAELEEQAKPRQIVYSCRFDDLRCAYVLRAQYGGRHDRVHHYAELWISEQEIASATSEEIIVRACAALAREVVMRIVTGGEL
jgi:hypothetical protein